MTKTDAVLKELDAMGLRPATLPELLAFGVTCPDIQSQFPLVALGSVWQRRDGNRFVPCLCCDSGERGLDLDWFEGGWGELCRFAAVCK